jgi:hypothetical protein
LLEELAAIGLSIGEELVEFLESASNTASSKAASSPSAQSPPPKATPPPPPPKKSEQSVDDMLAQLKKDMGLL